MPRFDFPPEGPYADLTTILEQHLRVGFQLDLALDLVLNELVVRAAEATHASSAALALSRGDELVCRAATGSFAPDLGVALNPREGLSGACLRTREPQISTNTESDPRIAATFSRRFGIRSVLAVPVFDMVDRSEFTGVLEVFSTAPAAFTRSQQELLEAFAEECSRVRYAALELSQRPTAEYVASESDPLAAALSALLPPYPDSHEPGENQASRVRAEQVFLAPVTVPVPPNPASREPAPIQPEPAPFTPEVATPEVVPPELETINPPPARGSPHETSYAASYEIWTLVLASLAILAIIGVSFLIGSRVGGFRASEPPAQASQPAPSIPPPPATVRSAGETKAAGTELARTRPVAQKAGARESRAATPAKSDKTTPDAGELVVYEKGKVVFRMKNPQGSAEQAQSDGSNADADTGSETASAEPTPTVPANPGPGNREKAASSGSVWLDPAAAEDRLISRAEPVYPAAARASQRAGEVVLEIQVAADGSVASVHTLSGDPLLAAAAVQAVRNWRYQPYRVHDRPSQFHTNVTLSFSAPN